MQPRWWNYLQRFRVAQYQLATPQAFYDLEKDPDKRVNLIDNPRIAR